MGQAGADAGCPRHGALRKARLEALLAPTAPGGETAEASVAEPQEE